MEEWYKKWKERRDPEALEQIVKKHEAFIQEMQKKWNVHFDPRVFRSLAKAQIIKALDSYDPNKGTQLSTHIYNYLQKLSRYAMSYGEAVRMPENLRLKVSSLMAAYEKLEELYGRPPTTDELADELGWPKKEVERIHKYMFEEKTESSLELPAVMDEYDAKAAVIESIYRELGPTEKIVFEHLTGYGGKPVLKAKDIAKLLNISPSQVTRIRQKIEAKFKEALDEYYQAVR